MVMMVVMVVMMVVMMIMVMMVMMVMTTNFQTSCRHVLKQHRNRTACIREHVLRPGALGKENRSSLVMQHATSPGI
jgi:hypothetical protein